jgi:hypothetical protein
LISVKIVWAIASIVCTDIDRCDALVLDTFETQGDCRRALLDTKHPDPTFVGTLAGRDCMRLRHQPQETNDVRPTRKPKVNS